MLGIQAVVDEVKSAWPIIRVAVILQAINARGLRDHIPVMLEYRRYFLFDGIGSGNIPWDRDLLMQCVQGHRFYIRDNFVNGTNE